MCKYYDKDTNTQDIQETHDISQGSRKLKNMFNEMHMLNIRGHTVKITKDTTTSKYRSKSIADFENCTSLLPSNNTKDKDTDTQKKLYGRKGSVSLRIFHNKDHSSVSDSSLSSKERDVKRVRQISQCKKRSDDNDDDNDDHDNDDDGCHSLGGSGKFSQTRFPSTEKQVDFSNYDMTNNQNRVNLPLKEKLHGQADVKIKLANDSSHIQRVSSATYYPHNTVMSGVGDIENVSSVEQVQSIEKVEDVAQSMKYMKSTKSTKSTDDIVRNKINERSVNDVENDRDISNNNTLLIDEEAIVDDDEDNGEVVKEDEQIKHATKGNQLEQEGRKFKEQQDEQDDLYEYPLAVELEPFKNKVGGHTEIFKFSERAVCKTLVNNENKWYENLEQLYATSGNKTTKNILQYMPKYIGVLNVRQHFNTLKEYMEAVGECEAPKNNTKVTTTDTNTDTNNNTNTDDDIMYHPGDSPKKHKKSIDETKGDVDGSQINNNVMFKKKNRCNSDTINEVLMDDNMHLFSSSLLNKISTSSNPFTSNSSSGVNINYINNSTRSDFNNGTSVISDRNGRGSNDWIADGRPIVNRRSSMSSNLNVFSSSALSTNSLNFFSSNTDELPHLHHTQSQGNLDEHAQTTMINTKLQEQVIKEVFAPFKHHSQGICSFAQNGSCSGRCVSNSHVRRRRRSDASSYNMRRLSTTHSNENFTDRKLSIHETDASETLGTTSNIIVTPMTPPKNSSTSVLSNKSQEDVFSSDLHTSNYKDISMSHPQPKHLEPFKQETFHGDIENKEETPECGAVFQMESAKRSISGSPFRPGHEDYTIVSQFILLEDLTRNMENPCVLDLKMGTRQYGVMANERKQKSQSLKCLKTTSRRLGCRVCGLKIWNPTTKTYMKKDKYFGRRIKIGWQFVRVLSRFLYNMESLNSILFKIPNLIENLDNLLEDIRFLKGYRLYGASLLFMYDGKEELSPCKIYLIDFAQCLIKQDFATKTSFMECPPKTPILWEDKGFTKGLKSLKFYLKAIWNYLTKNADLIYNQEDLIEFLESNKEKFSGRWDWLDSLEHEEESEFNDEDSQLRKKWMKYELIFNIEPPFENNDESS